MQTLFRECACVNGMFIFIAFDNKKESVASSIRCLVSLFAIILLQFIYKVNNFMILRNDDQSLNSVLVIM